MTERDPACDSSSIPARGRGRIALIAAAAGSVLLATQGSGSASTTRGVTATLRVPGNPGSVAAGRDALWLALADDQEADAHDRPLLRLDLATGTVERRIIVGGQARYLAHVGDRLLATVEHVGGGGSGPSLIVAFDWRNRPHPRAAAVSDRTSGRSRSADRTCGRCRSDPRHSCASIAHTMLPKSSSRPTVIGRRGRARRWRWLRLGDGRSGGCSAHRSSDTARSRGATWAVSRSASRTSWGALWVVDRDQSSVLRLDPKTLRLDQEAGCESAGNLPGLRRGGRHLFVGDPLEGTITRIDAGSGKIAGPAGERRAAR